MRLFYVLVIAGFVWWKFFRDPAVMERLVARFTHETVMTPPPPGMESWPFKTEQHWMVDEMGRDIAEMICYAKDPATPVSGDMVFAASAPSLEKGKFEFAARAGAVEARQYFTLAHHFWAPENYAPWAKLLLEKWNVKPAAPPTAPNVALIHALTSATQEILIGEAVRVSKELSQHPLDAELHEEAALLQGRLALLEAAGEFYDARHALCRMSAHLAMARALQEKAGACGQLAEVIQFAVAGRDSETLERVAQFPAELQPWGRALRMRATSDWRLLDHPEKATLLEQMEYGRALVRCHLTWELKDFVEKAGVSQMPQWGRLVMERHFNAGQGGMFVRGSLSLELQEMADDWKSWTGNELKKEGFILVANDTPGRCVANAGDGKQAMEVLGWGDLAAFHQRHICHSALRTDDLLQRVWCSWDEGTEFEKFMATELSGLRLMPIVLKRCALSTAAYAPAMRDCLALCNKAPQFVTAANWACVAEPETWGTQYKNIPAPQGWFSPDLPLGTLYDFAARYYELHHLWQGDMNTWEKALAMAPCHYDVIRAHRHKKYGEIPTAQQVEDSFAKISEYNLQAMEEIAEKSKEDQPKYIAALRKMALLNGDIYLQLGEYLLEQDRDAEALEAFRAGFEKAHDRVWMANRCKWLVNYEFDHGRKEEALKIATQAVNQDSVGGYETMGELMERMARWDVAERCFSAIAERYKMYGALTAFYMERKEKDPRAVGALNRLVDQVYPDGVEKATLVDFTTAPEDGAVFTAANEYVGSAHLKKGNVVVVLNGCRIHTVNQLMWVRALAGVEEPLRMVVWEGHKYIEVEASLPGRRFYDEMATYGRR